MKRRAGLGVIADNVVNIGRGIVALRPRSGRLPAALASISSSSPFRADSALGPLAHPSGNEVGQCRSERIRRWGTTSKTS